MLSRTPHGGLQLARSIGNPCYRCRSQIAPQSIRGPWTIFAREVSDASKRKSIASKNKLGSSRASNTSNDRERQPEPATGVAAAPKKRRGRPPKAKKDGPQSVSETTSQAAGESGVGAKKSDGIEGASPGPASEEPAVEDRKPGRKKAAVDFETHVKEAQEKATKLPVKRRSVSASTIKLGTPTRPLGIGKARATKQLMLQAKWPTAERLAKARTWKRGRQKKDGDATGVVDKKRVNIVSEDLCDDVLKYIGPSLERHRGCDLIDLNPGVGVFSRKMHDFLKPRKHVMMDVDANAYRPYLKDLLEKDNVVMIPHSGLIWSHLYDMMDAHLAHHQQIDQKDTPERNDTLLVVGNFTQWPRTAFASFESLGKLILYQFISSIRNTSLFQRYGCVRMLLWVNEEDKRQILPTALTLRKGVAVEAEASCEWIHEVVGKDINHYEISKFVRDHWMVLESAAKTARRMRYLGITMPPNRQSRLHKEIQERPELVGEELTGTNAPYLKRNWRKELADSSPDDDASEEELSRHKYLRNRQAEDLRTMPRYHRLLQLYQKIHIIAERARPNQERLSELTEEYRKGVSTLVRNDRIIFSTLLDSLIHFRFHKPPTLLHDRREYEPLVPNATDFFPNEPASLLDIQPKPVHSLLRQRGPKSTRSGDMSDLMLRQWYQAPTVPLSRNMDSLWPGFAEVGGALPSLTDARLGGSPVVDFTPRMLTERHWIDLVRAWMDWPFRPSYNEMLGRLLEEGEEDDEEDSTAANGIRD